MWLAVNDAPEQAHGEINRLGGAAAQGASAAERTMINHHDGTAGSAGAQARCSCCRA
jgi:hypothetical protein